MQVEDASPRKAECISITLLIFLTLLFWGHCSHRAPSDGFLWPQKAVASPSAPPEIWSQHEDRRECIFHGCVTVYVIRLQYLGLETHQLEFETLLYHKHY